MVIFGDPEAVSGGEGKSKQLGKEISKEKVGEKASLQLLVCQFFPLLFRLSLAPLTASGSPKMLHCEINHSYNAQCS